MKKMFSFLARKKKLTLFLILVIAGAVVWKVFFVKKSAVNTDVVKKSSVSEELILSGTVEADEHANLSFQGSGELAYIGVKEGDRVKKGQVLAKLDTTVLYQSFLQAEAELRKYQAYLDNIYDQLQGHSNNESYSQIEERTSAETNKDNAYRSYIAAQKNLSNASLKSPFDGEVISIAYPYSGVNTIFTQTQIEVLNPETLYFEVSADQNEVIKLKEGMDVKVVLDSFPKDEFEGKINFIASSPKAQEVGSIYRIKVIFSDVNELSSKILVGMTGDARFIVSQKDNVLNVPQKYIKSDSSGKYLKVGKSTNKIYVELGIEGENSVEVSGNNIKEGDVIFD
jgi:RND family efflux transporter MFP subunit